MDTASNSEEAKNGGAMAANQETTMNEPTNETAPAHTLAETEPVSQDEAAEEPGDESITDSMSDFSVEVNFNDSDEDDLPSTTAGNAGENDDNIYEVVEFDFGLPYSPFAPIRLRLPPATTNTQFLLIRRSRVTPPSRHRQGYADRRRRVSIRMEGTTAEGEESEEIVPIASLNSLANEILIDIYSYLGKKELCNVARLNNRHSRLATPILYDCVTLEHQALQCFDAVTVQSFLEPEHRGMVAIRDLAIREIEDGEKDASIDGSVLEDINNEFENTRMVIFGTIMRRLTPGQLRSLRMNDITALGKTRIPPQPELTKIWTATPACRVVSGEPNKTWPASLCPNSAQLTYATLTSITEDKWSVVKFLLEHHHETLKYVTLSFDKEFLAGVVVQNDQYYGIVEHFREKGYFLEDESVYCDYQLKALISLTIENLRRSEFLHFIIPVQYLPPKLHSLSFRRCAGFEHINHCYITRLRNIRHLAITNPLENRMQIFDDIITNVGSLETLIMRFPGVMGYPKNVAQLHHAQTLKAYWLQVGCQLYGTAFEQKFNTNLLCHLRQLEELALVLVHERLEHLCDMPNLRILRVLNMPKLVNGNIDRSPRGYAYRHNLIQSLLNGVPEDVHRPKRFPRLRVVIFGQHNRTVCFHQPWEAWFIDNQARTFDGSTQRIHYRTTMDDVRFHFGHLKLIEVDRNDGDPFPTHLS